VADAPLDRSRPYVAAGVLFFDDAGRILLVQPTYKDHWDIPGGYVENGETPSQAAVREIREELDFDAPVGSLLIADWAPHPNEGDKLLFVFDGGTLTAGQLKGIRLQADELASYALHDPAEVLTLLIPRLGRRVAAAIVAHRRGDTIYLENGIPHIRS
jgi:8-oxo-dGTP diphosphatase